MKNSKIVKLRKNSDLFLMKEWCMTIYDFISTFIEESSMTVNFFQECLLKAEKEKDIRLMKEIYQETIIMVRETFTPELIQKLNTLLKDKYEYAISDEIYKDSLAIKKIIKRGKIRNDREFEIVKRREEEIYDDDSQKEYAESLRKLMAEYE